MRMRALGWILPIELPRRFPIHPPIEIALGNKAILFHITHLCLAQNARCLRSVKNGDRVTSFDTTDGHAELKLFGEEDSLTLSHQHQCFDELVLSNQPSFLLVDLYRERPPKLADAVTLFLTKAPNVLVQVPQALLRCQCPVGEKSADKVALQIAALNIEVRAEPWPHSVAGEVAVRALLDHVETRSQPDAALPEGKVLAPHTDAATVGGARHLIDDLGSHTQLGAVVTGLPFVRQATRGAEAGPGKGDGP